MAPAPTTDPAAALVVAAAAGVPEAVREALTDAAEPEARMLPVADATMEGRLVMVTPAPAQSSRTAELISVRCVSTCWKTY
jgi:hypothetical protein